MVDPELLEPEGIRKISRVEYERLVDQGMFADERVELLQGLLVKMSPQGTKHLRISGWLVQELILVLGRTWDVFAHSSYAASDDSEPEPDISIVPRDESFTKRPSAAALVIEVSDSSLRRDRRIKAGIYAAAGIPEYWIVDISSHALAVEVRTEPQVGDYRRVEILRDGDVLRPSRLPGVEIAIRDIPWPR